MLEWLKRPNIFKDSRILKKFFFSKSVVAGFPFFKSGGIKTGGKIMFEGEQQQQLKNKKKSVIWFDNS